MSRSPREVFAWTAGYRFSIGADFIRRNAMHFGWAVDEHGVNVGDDPSVDNATGPCRQWLGGTPECPARSIAPVIPSARVDNTCTVLGADAPTPLVPPPAGQPASTPSTVDVFPRLARDSIHRDMQCVEAAACLDLACFWAGDPDGYCWSAVDEPPPAVFPPLDDDGSIDLHAAVWGAYQGWRWSSIADDAIVRDLMLDLTEERVAAVEAIRAAPAHDAFVPDHRFDADSLEECLEVPLASGP